MVPVPSLCNFDLWSTSWMAPKLLTKYPGTFLPFVQATRPRKKPPSFKIFQLTESQQPSKASCEVTDVVPLGSYVFKNIKIEL